MQERGIQERRKAGKEECRKVRMQKRMNTGKDGYRTGGRQEKDGCRTRGIQDRRDAGKERCRDAGKE